MSMSRTVCVAAAQMGPIARDEPRESAVARMMAMMREAHARGARLLVFPELALTTFFPRWWMEDEAELDAFYESDMPNRAARPRAVAPVPAPAAAAAAAAVTVHRPAGARHLPGDCGRAREPGGAAPMSSPRARAMPRASPPSR